MLWNCLLCSMKEFAWLFSRPYLLEIYTGIFTGESIWCLGFVFKYFRRKKNRWNKNDGIIILIILQLWLWVPGVHHVIFCTFKYIRNFFARRGFFKGKIFCLVSFRTLNCDRTLSHDLRNSVFIQPTMTKLLHSSLKEKTYDCQLD